MRAALGFAALAWCGATLALSSRLWFSRPTLTERLRPYAPSPMVAGTDRSVLSVASLRDVLGPALQEVGAKLARLFGASEDLDRRLRRCHHPLDVTSIRLRQTAAASLAVVAALSIAALVDVPLAVGAFLVIGAPILAFLVIEARVSAASDAWQQRIFLELPVIAEQLGMLLAAGYSLGAALQRLAQRGGGACSRDLEDVCRRVRQGVSEEHALREWADLADVTELDRLVQVLSLKREAGDLGRLIGEEARSARREVQRRATEQIERRGQQVWIPVTVATLVPGVLFLAVPFIEAMRLFTGG